MAKAARSAPRRAFMRQSCSLDNFPAIASGEAFPAISAMSMVWPETPNTSVATLASLMLAVSRSRSSHLALDECAARPQQVAKFPQRTRRHAALSDEAVTEQIGDPLGILHVGLRPSTFRMCRALPTISSKCPSSTARTGRQWTPVLSIPAWVTPNGACRFYSPSRRPSSRLEEWDRRDPYAPELNSLGPRRRPQ